MTRPTLDGLTADQWFHASYILAIVAILLVVSLFVFSQCKRGVAFLRSEQERWRRHQAWLAERQRLSATPVAYVRQQLQDRSVTHEPRPFPFGQWALPHWR